MRRIVIAGLIGGYMALLLQMCGLQKQFIVFAFIVSWLLCGFSVTAAVSFPIGVTLFFVAFVFGAPKPAQVALAVFGYAVAAVFITQSGAGSDSDFDPLSLAIHVFLGLVLWAILTVI